MLLLFKCYRKVRKCLNILKKYEKDIENLSKAYGAETERIVVTAALSLIDRGDGCPCRREEIQQSVHITGCRVA